MGNATAKPTTDHPRGPKADKIWANALRLAVMRESSEVDQYGKKRNFLSLIAQNMVLKAVEGDVMATKEIGDRLDGRPAQAIEATGNLTVIIAASDKSFT